MNDRVVFVLFPRSDTRLKTLWSTVTGSTGETHALPARTAMSANRAQSPVSLSFRCFFSPWVPQRNSVTKAGASTIIAWEYLSFSFPFLLSLYSIFFFNENTDNEFWLLYQEIYKLYLWKIFFYYLYFCVDLDRVKRSGVRLTQKTCQTLFLFMFRIE